MNRMLSIAYPSLVICAVLAVMYMAAYSPSARCANRRDGVWVSALSRCMTTVEFGIPAGSLERAR